MSKKIFFPLFLLLHVSLFATEVSFPSYEAQKVETFKGQIVSVQKINMLNRPVPYVQFTLSTQEGEYIVQVGPERYINEHGLVLLQREAIEVKGSLVSGNGKNIILATLLKKGDLTLKLRQEDGTPLWHSPS